MSKIPKTPMRKWREANGLTIADVSRRTGIPNSTVRAVDIGVGLGFNPKVKARIAEAMGADPFEIFPEILKLFDYISGRGYVIEKPGRTPKGKRGK